MIWLLTAWKALTSPVGRALASVALIAAAVLAFNWLLDREFEKGRAAERFAAIARANDLIAKMEQDNAQISDLDHRAKCAEFGFNWLPDTGCH